MPRTRVLLFSLLLLPFTFYLLPFRLAIAETTNGIVALVNDEVVTEGDVRAFMSALLSQDGAPKAANPTEQAAMAQVALQRLIEEHLIVQEAKRLGLIVSPEDVLDRLRAIKSQFPDKEKYERMLEDMGLNEEQLKAKLRDQLFARRAIDQQVRSTIHISPNELAEASAPAPAAPAAPTAQTADAPEEMQVWHLLVRAGERRSKEDAQKLVTTLRQQVMSGGSLDEIARQHSEDPHAADGGMLGWVHRGDLLPELDQALSALKGDELSEPIESTLGFHLLKVVQRRAAGSAPSPATSQSAEEQLYQQKFSVAMKAWVEGLKAKAYIQVMNE